MLTQDALTLLDQEVQSLDYEESSLNIELVEEGCSPMIFIVTFEGNMHMSRGDSLSYGALIRRFKISLMTEARWPSDNQLGGGSFDPESGDMIVTVRATKMEVQM
jgi:hypothetical protein